LCAEIPVGAHRFELSNEQRLSPVLPLQAEGNAKQLTDSATASGWMHCKVFKSAIAEARLGKEQVEVGK
jgi:hypothetical protein